MDGEVHAARHLGRIHLDGLCQLRLALPGRGSLEDDGPFCTWSKTGQQVFAVYVGLRERIEAVNAYHHIRDVLGAVAGDAATHRAIQRNDEVPAYVVISEITGN